MNTHPDFLNSDLLNQKNQLLKRVEDNFTDLTNSKYVCSYSFHGFCLNFHGVDEEFVRHITSFLPASWALRSDTSLPEISFYLTNEWGDDWDLEENADCLINRTKEMETAIQRDFVGVDKGERIVIALDRKQSDGIFNALRWVMPRRLLEKGFFLLHSSCVVTDGKAQFFLGHSGAGKSTVASLSGDRIVLGDDMNIMRLKDGKIFARAGGLGGMSFENTDFSNEFPVSEFFWLSQSNEDKKELLSNTKAITKFLASLANIFWEHLNNSEREELLKMSTEIVSKCSFYKLHFTKSKECWNNVI